MISRRSSSLLDLDTREAEVILGYERRALSVDGHRRTVQPFPRRATPLWRGGNVLAHDDHRIPIAVSLPGGGGGLLPGRNDCPPGKVSLLRDGDRFALSGDDRLSAKANLLRDREGLLPPKTIVSRSE